MSDLVDFLSPLWSVGFIYSYSYYSYYFYFFFRLVLLFFFSCFSFHFNENKLKGRCESPVACGQKGNTSEHMWQFRGWITSPGTNQQKHSSYGRGRDVILSTEGVKCSQKKKKDAQHDSSTVNWPLHLPFVFFSGKHTGNIFFPYFFLFSFCPWASSIAVRDWGEYMSPALF